MTSLNYEKHLSYRRVFYFRICKYCNLYGIKFLSEIDNFYFRMFSRVEFKE